MREEGGAGGRRLTIKDRIMASLKSAAPPYPPPLSPRRHYSACNITCCQIAHKMPCRRSQHADINHNAPCPAFSASSLNIITYKLQHCYTTGGETVQFSPHHRTIYIRQGSE